MPKNRIHTIFNFLNIWRGFSFQQKRALVEAFYELTKAKVQLKLLPFKKVANGLGNKQGQLKPRQFTEQEKSRVRLVMQMIAIAQKYVFWESVCLDQAIAAKRMLSARGIESALHFGVTKDPKNVGLVAAHAWLMTHENFLITGKVNSDFNQIAVFV